MKQNDHRGAQPRIVLAAEKCAFVIFDAKSYERFCRAAAKFQ